MNEREVRSMADRISSRAYALDEAAYQQGFVTGKAGYLDANEAWKEARREFDRALDVFVEKVLEALTGGAQ